jgi:ferredoxin-NADP reductase
VAVTWLPARLVAERFESAGSRTLVLDVPDLAPTIAGQHVDVRLTAPDGYTAQRSYSIASAAGADPIEIVVDRLPDGEVSPYLVDGLPVGESVEVAGPIGRWFAWTPEEAGPVQLVAGGSGIVPLMAMLRTRAAAGSAAPFRLLASVRDPDHRFFEPELAAMARGGVVVDTLYTRAAPSGGRPAGRITAADLAATTIGATERPTVYVCGPSGFVDAVADLLLTAGHDARRIRTERFGPSGG